MGRPANDSVNCSINNIYQLEGRVPIGKAIPFGLQHILAMFVSNLAPITIIAGAASRLFPRLRSPFCSRMPCLLPVLPH